MRCKQAFKKSISNACCPILRSSSATRPSDQRCFPLPGNTFPGASRNSRRQRCSTFGLTSTPRATSAIDTPCSSRRTAANLNSFVNCLRDNPIDSILHSMNFESKPDNGECAVSADRNGAVHERLNEGRDSAAADKTLVLQC